MTHVRRLSAVAAVLAVAAWFTAFTAVRGGPGKKDAKNLLEGAEKTPALEENLAATKFAARSVVAYLNREGKKLIGWQVKAAIPESPPRPRDYLILIDT